MSRVWPVDGIDPDGTLAANARRILAVRMAEFYAHAPAVGRPEASQALHDLRIAAKRLRYTLELFRVVFGDPGERQIERVKALQEELGELHDHDVRLALIEEELVALERGGANGANGDHPTPPDVASADDPRLGLLAFRQGQRASRAEHYRALVALWDRAQAEGMRAELAMLSATPPEEVGVREGAAAV